MGFGKSRAKMLTEAHGRVTFEDVAGVDEAKEELKTLEPELERSKRDLQILLLPKDPNDHKNVVFEVRAGAGGEEAALFVAELFRLYQRYCERQGWRVDVPVSALAAGVGVALAVGAIAGLYPAARAARLAPAEAVRPA